MGYRLNPQNSFNELSLCLFLTSYPADLPSAIISPPLLHVGISLLYINLSTFTSLQPLAPPPLTRQKTSPNTCPPSPAAKPTGGPGTAAWGHSTCPSPPTSFQSTPLEATCPRAAWATSSLLLPDAPGACRIPLLLGEVIDKHACHCQVKLPKHKMMSNSFGCNFNL